jgi:anthranilate phosphoribosyltransferase
MPEDLGFKTIRQDELYGGDTPEEAASIFRNVLNATATDAQINVVIVNAALGIQTIDQHRSIEECIDIARSSLYSKKALKVLETFVEINS